MIFFKPIVSRYLKDFTRAIVEKEGKGGGGGKEGGREKGSKKTQLS